MSSGDVWPGLFATEGGTSLAQRARTRARLSRATPAGTVVRMLIIASLVVCISAPSGGARVARSARRVPTPVLVPAAAALQGIRTP